MTKDNTIELNPEVCNIEEGTHKGTIIAAFKGKNKRVVLKIKLGADTTFVVFSDEFKIGNYPYNQLFMQLNSNCLDDLIGKDVEFQISNKTDRNTGKVFSNIRKIHFI